MWDVRVAVLGDKFYHVLLQDGWEPFAMGFFNKFGQIVGGDPEIVEWVGMRKQVDAGINRTLGNRVVPTSTEYQWMYPTPRAD